MTGIEFSLFFVIIYFIVLEITHIDPWFWDKGRSDKPISTLIYAGIALVVSVSYSAVVEWWWTLIFFLTVRVSVFDLLYNTLQENELFYHPKKNAYERFWASMSPKTELIIRILTFVIPILLWKILFM